jgi:hypothetical protein
MTIGYSSGGTNNDADVTFPALGVTGVISEVRLYYAWDNINCKAADRSGI